MVSFPPTIADRARTARRFYQDRLTVVRDTTDTGQPGSFANCLSKSKLADAARVLPGCTAVETFGRAAPFPPFSNTQPPCTEDHENSIPVFMQSTAAGFGRNSPPLIQGTHTSPEIATGLSFEESILEVIKPLENCKTENCKTKMPSWPIIVSKKMTKQEARKRLLQSSFPPGGCWRASAGRLVQEDQGDLPEWLYMRSEAANNNSAAYGKALSRFTSSSYSGAPGAFDTTRPTHSLRKPGAPERAGKDAKRPDETAASVDGGEAMASKAACVFRRASGPTATATSPPSNEIEGENSDAGGGVPSPSYLSAKMAPNGGQRPKSKPLRPKAGEWLVIPQRKAGQILPLQARISGPSTGSQGLERLTGLPPLVAAVKPSASTSSLKVTGGDEGHRNEPIPARLLLEARGSAAPCRTSSDPSLWSSWHESGSEEPPSCHATSPVKRSPLLNGGRSPQGARDQSPPGDPMAADGCAMLPSVPLGTSSKVPLQSRERADDNGLYFPPVPSVDDCLRQRLTSSTATAAELQQTFCALRVAARCRRLRASTFQAHYPTPENHGVPNSTRLPSIRRTALHSSMENLADLGGLLCMTKAAGEDAKSS